MKIYQQNPPAKQVLCPKMPVGGQAGAASRPFSACGGCQHFSFTDCSAVEASDEFSVSPRKVE
ncbi:MAG: hypothetical protein FWC93_03745 [Defluviitaleaceae bacterium]|nr:hypothetical protein [Defluviitaleaceae bacterium]